MKKKYILTLVTLILAVTNVQATSYTWIGTTSNWSTSSNWSPAGVPDSADNVTISTGTYNLALDQNRKVTNLTLTSKTINLSTYTLTVYGTATMNSGTVTNGAFKCRGTLASFKGTLMDCPVDAVCGYIQLSGSTFNDVADFTDQGTASGTGTGGCTFNGNVTITHNGTLTYFTLANTTGDTFNANVTFTNNSNREINVATSGSTSFNGNIIVNSTSTGGILFANSGGTSTLASGKTISVGSSGFTADYLTLKNFTQTGSTAQTLTLTSTAIVNMISSTFNGNLTITAPGFLLKNNTFNGTVTLTRNASSGNHQSDGGNYFNNTTSIDNSGSSGRIRFATTTGDIFNANATFSSSGSQDVQIAYSGNTIFEGNLTINSNKVVFNTASGKVTFAGGNSQTLNGSYNYSFKKLAINKSANNLTANTTLSVDDTLFFVSGKLITTSSNLLTMKAGSASSGASNASFVSGPVKKIGSSSFQFPVGKNNVFRKVEITAPSNATDAFTAEYFDSTQVLGSTMDTTISFISDCGYWNLSRTTGTSIITPKFAFDSTHCDYLSIKPVHIAFWNGTKWIDKGEGVTASNNKKTSAAVSSFGNFAMAYKLVPGDAPQMPYELTVGTTCTETQLLFNKKNIWLSFHVDSAMVKIRLLKSDASKVYAAIKGATIYEDYAVGDTLTMVQNWSLDCDSALTEEQYYQSNLDVTHTYLLKVEKYYYSECELVNDSLTSYLGLCIRNVRTTPGPHMYAYSDKPTLEYALSQSFSGDLVVPAITTPPSQVVVDLSGSTAPLVVEEGVTLIGNYDLLSEQISIPWASLAGGYYSRSTFPNGTLITSKRTDTDPTNYFIFDMKPNSTIRNLRIRGAMPGYMDYNNDLELCAGIRLNEISLTNCGPFTIQHCEIFNFSKQGIYASVNSNVKLDMITGDGGIRNNYIHHIRTTGDGQSAKGYGIWIKGALVQSNFNQPATNFPISGCIFDECKEAIDCQPNPANMYVSDCTFGNFFTSEVINKHSYGGNGCLNCEYNHPDPNQTGCDFYIPGNPCTSETTDDPYDIPGPGAGNTFITNSIFHSEGTTVSIPYPANSKANSNYSPNGVGIPLYNIKVKENTFTDKHSTPSDYDCQNGGYARVNDNHIDACCWDYERTHNVLHEDLLGTGVITDPNPIIENTPNSFDYLPGHVTTSGCPQPPEFDFDFDTPVGYISNYPYISAPIPFVNEGDNIKIQIQNGSLSTGDLSYIIRPKTNNGSAIGSSNYSANNSYDASQLVLGPTSSQVVQEFSPTGSLPEWNTNHPGLYGIDVFAVDGSSNSNYNTSKMVYKPIIVQPNDNHLLIFNIKDSYYADLNSVSSPMGVFKQVELNGHIIWQEDITVGGDDWEWVKINLLTDQFNGINISTYFDVTKLNQTITFSIAMPTPASVNTNDLRGLQVWVDDVYLRRIDSPENLIKDGSVELAQCSGLGETPSATCTWYSKCRSNIMGCPSLDDGVGSSTAALTEAGVTSVERKSGFQAIRLKLDGVYSSVCNSYNSIAYDVGMQPDVTNYARISAAIVNYRKSVNQ